MKWRRGTGAGQVEDFRGRGGGGGLGGIPIGKAGGGGLGLIVVLVVLFLSGGFPGGGGGGSGFPINLPSAPAGPGAGGEPPASDDGAQFVQFVVADVQATWKRIFAEANQTYEPTTLRLFTSGIETGCGGASSDVGPFYCPADKHVYIDLGFFRELQSRFGAKGDFAQAYVIAHEFGHHVQNVLGVSADVRQQQQEDPEGANELSIKLELQADCLAGVWGHSADKEGLLDPGDVEEGLNAAAAVGDDRIQQKSGRGVNPESWTHGSAEQRMEWFRKGFEQGDPSACDTFKGDV
ncbi:MAG: zinc metallopeptidase [Gaiellaceae bacterium MAG52_C11]|nr:zinc metallopeptidase [Candidatus Gaiellasilicea maunaloa]